MSQARRAERAARTKRAVSDAEAAKVARAGRDVPSAPPAARPAGPEPAAPSRKALRDALRAADAKRLERVTARVRAVLAEERAFLRPTAEWRDVGGGLPLRVLWPVGVEVALLGEDEDAPPSDVGSATPAEQPGARRADGA